MPPRNEIWRGLAWALAALAPFALLALAMSFWFAPEAVAGGAPWRVLGFDPPACSGCAFCGMSRAFSALSHGHPAAAISFHPAVLLAWPLAWIVALGGPAALARTFTTRG